MSYVFLRAIQCLFPMLTSNANSRKYSSLPLKLEDPFFADLAQKNRMAMEAYEKLAGSSVLDVPRDLRDASSRRNPMLQYRVVKARLVRAAVAYHACGDKDAWNFATATIDALLDPEIWAAKFAKKDFRIQYYDLRMSDLLYCCAFALEAFGVELEFDEHRRMGLVNAIIHRGLAAYNLGYDAEEWWRTAEFNWGAATHGNAGVAALAIASHDPELSAKILARVRAGIQHVIDYLPEGGGWTEGPMYLTTTLGHLSDFAIALFNQTGDDLGLTNNPRWLEVLNSRRHMLMPDGKLLNFSNCPIVTSQFFLPQIYWWAERLNQPEWNTFEDSICKEWWEEGGVFHDVESFLYRPAYPPKPVLSEPPALFHFTELDWLIWRGDHLWMAIRSGNNGGNHNNFDLGHFILGSSETRYLVDPGYGASATSQHNAVSIRGHNQAEGATARLLHKEVIASGVYFAFDLTAAYPYRLERHLRHMLVLDNNQLLLIDELHGRDGVRVSSRYHFQTDLPVAPCPGGVRIEAAPGALHLLSLSGHDPAAVNSYMPPGGEYASVSQINFQTDADRPRELSLMLLSFDPTSAPTVTEDQAEMLIVHSASGIARIYLGQPEKFTFSLG